MLLTALVAVFGIADMVQSVVRFSCWLLVPPLFSKKCLNSCIWKLIRYLKSCVNLVNYFSSKNFEEIIRELYIKTSVVAEAEAFTTCKSVRGADY